MKTILALLLLTGCAAMDQPVLSKTAYEMPPALNYDMNCKEIKQALIEAKASLERVKERRNTTTDEDVTMFLLSMGTPTQAGFNAQKAAEERIALLESASTSRRCTITQ